MVSVRSMNNCQERMAGSAAGTPSGQGHCLTEGRSSRGSRLTRASLSLKALRRTLKYFTGHPAVHVWAQVFARRGSEPRVPRATPRACARPRSGPPALPRFAIVGIVLLCSSSCTEKVTGPSYAPDLPSPPNEYSEPAWHPSGRMLVFNHLPLARRFVDPKTGQYVYVYAESLNGLWTVNADGTGQRRLLPFNAWTPDWDSSGTTLTYQQSGHIWTMSAADSGVVPPSATRITAGGQGEYAPTWRLDGEVIAFCINSMPGIGVYEVPRAGGTPRMVGDIGWSEPDWSPRGDSLVFLAMGNSNQGIGIADSSGQGFRMLWGYPQATVSYPRWSPDGGTIAFTGRTNNAGSYELWVMQADGANAHAITTGGVQQFFSWSPDGREIAYVRSTPHDTSLVNGTIWIINPLTGDKRQLTFNTPSN